MLYTSSLTGQLAAILRKAPGFVARLDLSEIDERLGFAVKCHYEGTDLYVGSTVSSIFTTSVV